MRVVCLVSVLAACMSWGCGLASKSVGGEVAFQLVVPPDEAFPKEAAKPAVAHALVPNWDRTKALSLVPSPAFTTPDFKEVFLRRVESGRYEIELVLTMAASRRFGTFTGANRGAVMAVVVDGRVISAFVLRDRIDAGRVVLPGEDDARTRAWHAAIVGTAGGRPEAR